MMQEPPILQGLWDAIPPASQAALQFLFARYEQRIQQLEEQNQLLQQRLGTLETQIGKDSTNSSKPPASEHPHAKPPRPKSRSKRSPGGQPGHPKHARPLLPPEQCQEVVPCVPTACRRCGQPLTGTDPEPLRHQVWELPEIKPNVTEYQRHRLLCACGCSTCGELPAGVPTGQGGPRLIAFSGLLMACFRQSKRRAAQFLSMILNQPASPGWLVRLQDRAAEAVQPAYAALANQLPVQPVLRIDESPTKEGSRKAWVWTFVAGLFTFFACRTSRGADVPKQLLGEDFPGIINCDRARMYWAFGRLQWCWAHLKRDFQALIDNPCKVSKRLGHDLMRETKKMFALWQQVRDGTIARHVFQEQMKPIRQRVEGYLVRGYFDARLHGFCKELYDYRARLWVFVEVEGVEPTNNASEQALRQAVIWRKLSFGTQSASGSRFVERLLTVIETCRRQRRNVFTWMTEAVQAHLNGQSAPSLLLAP
jgi:transposase